MIKQNFQLNLNPKQLNFFYKLKCYSNSQLLLLWLLFSSIPGYAQNFTPHWRNTINRGRVIYLKMEEASWNGTAGESIDLSGNGNNGQAKNGANTTASGYTGRGASFDGTNDYLTVPSSASLNFNGVSNAFTIALRFKTSSTASLRLACKGQWGVGTGWLLAMNYVTSGHLTFGFNGIFYGTSTSYNDNAWHQAVFVYNGTSARIYMDGALANLVLEHSWGDGPNNSHCATITGGNVVDVTGCTGGNATGYLSTTDPLTLGAYQGGSGGPFEPFSGTIDSFMMWSRALSSSEVTKLLRN